MTSLPVSSSQSWSTRLFLSLLLIVTTIDAFAVSVPKQQQQESYWTSQAAKDATPPFILSKILDSPWRGGLEPAVDVPEEILCETIQGNIPRELSGTLFRNGPGRIRVGESLYGNWFDGDGYVVKLSIKDQTVSLRARYVQTERYKKEGDGENGLSQRGAWTDARNGNLLANLFKKPSNPANTSCRIVKRGTESILLALAEGGAPHCMDPKTLETIGFYDYNAPQEFGTPDSCASAHPVDCPETGEMYTCGLRLGVASAWPSLAELKAFKFIQVSDGSLQLDCETTIELPRIAFVHDMAISKHHVVFVIAPYQATGQDLIASIFSTPPLGKRFKYEQENGTRIVVLSRKDLKVVADVTTNEYLSTYHLVNARDVDNDGSVEVQVAAHIGPRQGVERVFGNMYGEVFTDEERCRLRSVAIDTNNNKVVLRNVGPSDASAFELPAVHPRFIGKQHGHVFTNAAYPSTSELLNCIERLDLETNQVDRASFGPHRYAMEPVVVPKKGSKERDVELNAFVLTLVYDSTLHVADLVILEASNLGAGPIATVRMPTHVPFGFHGTWSNELFE